MNIERENLKDVTFLIPLRLDSINRLENLIMTTSYLCNMFDCNIHVLEASDFNNGLTQRLLGNNISYTFIEDKDPVFYRTKYLNIMAKQLKTDILALWDSDIIIPKEQIIDAVTQIRSGNASFSYPYNGIFLDTSEIIRQYYWKNQRIESLIRNKSKMKLIYGNQAKGGAIFAKVEAYKASGMENENYYGWGCEDNERYTRWSQLGYKIYHAIGCLFHLSHSRGLNSKYRNSKTSDFLNNEHRLIAMSSGMEILHAIKNTNGLKK